MEVISIITLVLAILSVILTGVYVFLTLRIANKTAESVTITRDALVASQWQSQAALTASETQSKAAIDAVSLSNCSPVNCDLSIAN